jgi:hypothetical protein
MDVEVVAEPSVRVSDIQITGLPKRKPFNIDPDPFVTISVDEKQEQRTTTLKKTRNLAWDRQFVL